MKRSAFQLTERPEDDDTIDDVKFTTISAKNDLFDIVTDQNVSYIRYKNYDLHLVLKNEVQLDRPKIPATQFQRITYFRYFCCSPIKQQVISLNPTHFLAHLWRHVYRNIIEHLPFLFTILFLSVYTPHEHFYVSKMFPLFWGCTLQVIMCGFFQMTFVSSNLSLLMDYVVYGLIFRGPWNRCKNETYLVRGTTVRCYKIQDFIGLKKINATFEDIGETIFYKNNGTFFQAAQLLYYDERRTAQFPNQSSNFTYICEYNIFVLYFCIIWLAAPFFYHQLFKKTFWKVYHCLFWIIFAIYALALFYIELMFYIEQVQIIPEFERVHELEEHIEKGISIMLERYGEVLTTPPMVHLIYSRSKSEVKPGRHSALLVISNGLYFLFQEIVYLRLQSYCDSITGVQLQADEYNSYPFYFLWPIFFHSFPIGSVLTKMFFITLFLMEYLTFAITYQGMLETVSCEWSKIKWWMVSIILTGFAFLYRNVVTSANLQIQLYVVGTALATITEIVVIFWLYPCGRLIEDINFFYYANTVTKLRQVFLRIMPVLFMIIMVVIFRDLVKKLGLRKVIFLIGIPMAPVLFGFCYQIFLTYIKRKPCASLIRPLPSWGPQDNVARMFRKKFDEQKFIDSLSDRFLSRYMLKKAEPPNYLLGVQYEAFRKRSTLFSINPVSQ